MIVLLLSLSVFAEPIDPCAFNPATAVRHGGHTFPSADAFASTVVSYVPGPGVRDPHRDASAALGPPDWHEGIGAVSLGNGKRRKAGLVLEFVGIYITDIPGPDLYVFEVGPLVERTEVAISPDGETWTQLGAIHGSTRAIDIAPFGVSPDVHYRYLRLKNAGRPSRPPYAGADIDSVGAIGACRLP
ncbi:MAG: hypothetical protein HN348_25140 [Proteobacteria bacterium]|jgi:hypothetical protein|nr:hypothetical protein [Pseudomonadota bacterium]